MKKRLAVFFLLLFWLLLLSENGLCRTPVDLDRVIQAFNQSQTPESQLELSYQALDLYAPLTQKSQVDPDDRTVLSRMKRLVITDAMERAGDDVLVTAVGSTGYWVLKRSDRIVNDYPADDPDRIVELKRQGCYMEGLSDLDFVIMGAGAAAYQSSLRSILAKGIGDTHLVPEELENLEISFITDEQVQDLAAGPRGRNFWNQLMNLEESSSHAEKYITKGGKALYGMEHLFEEGAVAVSDQGTQPGKFKDYAEAAGHNMGPFTLAHLFGGACDMDYFLTHALEKTGQENVKTVLQVIKYLKRQAWMLRRAAKNLDQLPDDVEAGSDNRKVLENYADRIDAFTKKAADDKVWKNDRKTAQFGEEARELSGLICTFAHERLMTMGSSLLWLRSKKELTGETETLLSLIVYDLTIVDEERYPEYPSWYAYEKFYEDDVHRIYPRDNTLAFLEEYRTGKSADGTETNGPVVSISGSEKNEKMDIGPILPPPVAAITIDAVQVSPEEPIAGAPVTFTVSGSVAGVSETMPDFSGLEYQIADRDAMKSLGYWSLKATLYRMQTRYLMDLDLASKKASSSSDRIYVSPYEISHITEEYLNEAEETISMYSEILNRGVADDENEDFILGVRAVPSIESIDDYVKNLLNSCKESKKKLKKGSAAIDWILETLEIAGGQDGGGSTNTAADKNSDAETENDLSFSAVMAEMRKGNELYANTAIQATELAEDILGKTQTLKGLLDKDPSAAAKIAGEVEKKLTKLASMTAESLAGARKQRLDLLEGIADAHLYVVKDPELKVKFDSMVEEWKNEESFLTTQTLPDLEKKAIWLNRGAWAAKSAKWGFEAIAAYNEFQEQKATLASTDFSEGTENAVLALHYAGKAIENVAELIPIPVLKDLVENYASVLKDVVKWAPIIDSIQSRRYQDMGFDIRSNQIPAAYKTIIELDPSRKSTYYYRSRMPLAEYNNLTIFAYPQNEKTETGRKKRDMMWFVWDKHNPDGYLHLDKEKYKKMSLYAAWYRRIYGENIPANILKDLIVTGEYKETATIQYEPGNPGSELVTKRITADALEEKAASILSQRAFEAYLRSLTGRESFGDGEVYIYQSMLFHAAEKFAEHDFLLTNSDVRKIMDAVFYEKPISDEWASNFDALAMTPVSSDSINYAATVWDKITGGEKTRLESVLESLIEEKDKRRIEEREKHWKAARNPDEDGFPVAAGLLYPETGLVLNHALLSETGESYGQDYIDIDGEKFSITWKATLPGDTDYKTATYLCIAEIAGYPGTRIQFSLPMDEINNEILNRMLELAGAAEEKGNTAWSVCQGAAVGVDAFLESKDELAPLLEKLQEMNRSFDATRTKAVRAPDLLDRNAAKAESLSVEIEKLLTEIKNLQSEICDAEGSDDSSRSRQLRRMKELLATLREKAGEMETLAAASEEALAAWEAFEEMLASYHGLFFGENRRAVTLTDGFAESLTLLAEGEAHRKELTALKGEAETLLSEGKRVYSAPDSASTLEKIQRAHDRVHRPLDELAACLKPVDEKRVQGAGLYETLKGELTRAERYFEKFGDMRESMASETEAVETMGRGIWYDWQASQEQLLKGESRLAAAEACLGPDSGGTGAVPDLAGMTMSSAKAAVKAAGFTAVLRGGDPAPTKALAYTVASQSPVPGELLSAGGSVTVVLYGGFSGEKVPDVLGLPSAKAREKIEAAGFKVSLEGGDSAPREDLKYRVQSQTPGADEKAESGATVRVRIYGDVQYASVPSLESLTVDEAKAAVSDAGLVSSLHGGNSAPKKALSYRVQAQYPEPGTRVVQGSAVKIQVYGKFNKEAALANASCDKVKGSTLQWSDKKDTAVCVCPSNMILNDSKTACVADPSIAERNELRNQFWSAVISTAVPLIIDEMTGGSTTGGSSSGGNTDTRTSTGGSSTSSGSTGTSSGGNTGSSGVDSEACETKFCPECASDAIDLITVSVNEQCNECRERYKDEIEKCMAGEKTGPGNKYVKKAYVVIAYYEWDEDREAYICKSVEMQKTSDSRSGKSERVYGPDTWDACWDAKWKLYDLLMWTDLDDLPELKTLFLKMD